MDDPLLLLKGGRISANVKVKDINGTVISFKGMDLKTAQFDVPEIK